MIKKFTFFIILILLILSASLVSASPPAETVDGQAYTVQANDWLSKIAEKYYDDVLVYPIIVEATNAKATEDDSFALIEDPDLIEVGQKLWIPDPGLFDSAALTVAEVTNFFLTIQAAVEAGDAATLAAQVGYPISVSLGEEEPSPIQSAEEFIEHYSQIIDDGVKEAVLNQEITTLFASWRGIMAGQGELWFSGICSEKGENGSVEDCKIAIIGINNAGPAASDEEEEPSTTTTPASDLFGEWVVVEYAYAGITDQEIDPEADLGKSISIEENTIVLDDETCDSVTFDRSMADTSEELQFYYGQDLPQDITQDQVELIALETDCELEWLWFPTLMKLDETTIVSLHSGYILFWEKQGN